MKKHQPVPRPWKHVGKGKMSAVLDHNGSLICGSLICEQNNPDTIKAHKLIVQWSRKQFH